MLCKIRIIHFYAENSTWNNTKIISNDDVDVVVDESKLINVLEGSSYSDGLKKDEIEEKGEETDFDLKGYADYLLKSISVTAEIKTEDGITYFEYSKKPDDIKYNYFVSVYKTEDAFWFIQFSCQSDKINEYRPLFIKWAKSVFFDWQVDNIVVNYNNLKSMNNYVEV